jgi:predicted DNA-binding transcriptional regulator AlpA
MSDRIIVDWRGLKNMGWPFSRAHTWRMMKARVFPQSSKLGDHRNSHPVWVVKEILAYFESHGLKVTD